MRIGIDGYSLADRTQAGLFQYLLGLLKGLQQLSPRPDVFLYQHPTEAQSTQSLLRDHSIDFRTQVYAPPRGRPFRLRQWLAATFGGLNSLDVFLATASSRYPTTHNRVNAYLIPDITITQTPQYHTPGSRIFWEEYIKIARENADLIVTFSEHTRRDVISLLGIRPELVVAIPLAPDERFRPLPPEVVRTALQPLYLEPGQYLLTVGTLEPRKNHLALFRGYANYLARTGARRLPLVVAGPEGWMSDPILAEPARLGIADHVRFVGRVPDLTSLYNGATAFVYPSIYEGFGLPPLEAMACGVPTLVANATSLPEVVGETGVFFDPANDVDLADNLQRVLMDEGLQNQLSRSGIERARSFSWCNTAERYLTAFHAAIDRKHGTAH